MDVVLLADGAAVVAWIEGIGDDVWAAWTDPGKPTGVRVGKMKF